MGKLLSMTGYGSAKGSVEGQEITVELKSVNNRYLDCSVRLPRNFLFAEDTVKQAVSAGVSRGKVDVFVSAQASQDSGTVVSVNEELARGYRDAVAHIAETLGLESGLNAFSLARFPDVLTVERRELDKDKAAAALSEITAKAVEEFNAMREREGERLRRDMLGKLETIEGLVSVVEERSPQTVKEYRERLEARLRDILADRSLDEQRVITEAAIFADRAAVDEITRKSIDDPMCIGYFIDNELAFGGIVKAVFGAEPDQPAKLEFVKDLKAKYGTIEALNKVWDTSYADWDGLLQSKAMPEGKGFRKDADAFNNKFIERYFELSRKGIKSLAPHRLYLGCRFVGFRHAEAVRRIAAKYSDVISINSYHNSIANVSPDQFFGKPMLIGEFHFGTYDRGMFAPSLCPVGTQQERATSYMRFVQGALTQPHLVGTHYFQFRDQPLTGRWDGEGYQIGFVDVADTPYRELCESARETGEHMYQYRLNGKAVNDMK